MSILERRHAVGKSLRSRKGERGVEVLESDGERWWEISWPLHVKSFGGVEYRPPHKCVHIMQSMTAISNHETCLMFRYGRSG